MASEDEDRRRESFPAHRARWIVGLLALPLIVGNVSCSGAGGPVAPAPGREEGISELLSSLPAAEGSDAPLVVTYGDLGTAAEIAGVEPPSDLDDRDATVGYLNALSGRTADEGERPPPASVAWPRAAHLDRVAQADEFAEDVGWTIFQGERFIARETLPETVTVLDGRFDRGALDDALGEADQGIWVAGDPERRDPDNRTPARPLGEPLWLSLEDDRLLVAGSDEAMEAARSVDDSGPTLADDPTLSALARALDEEDVYTAQLHGGRPASLIESLPPDSPSERLEEICDQALAEAPLGVAAGLADDDGPVVVLAFVHDSEAEAEANAEAVEHIVEQGRSALRNEPWSEDLIVDRVAVDDEVTVARLRPTDDGRGVRIWQEVLQANDSLVTAC